MSSGAEPNKKSFHYIFKPLVHQNDLCDVIQYETTFVLTFHKDPL